MSYRTLLQFIQHIGLEVQDVDLPEATFLPGLTIQNGVLLVDPVRLLYPGDLLHEAGHLAILPPAERALANAPIDDDGGYEMAAIAWSYAAAVHLGLPLETLFHPAGYKGGSENLIENFQAGRYIGVPLLEWAGLTLTGQRAEQAGVAPYPHMLRWLRA